MTKMFVWLLSANDFDLNYIQRMLDYVNTMVCKYDKHAVQYDTVSIWYRTELW